ncbi:MAG TPA: DinB family protein [Gemmatimonadales bacterium]|nr:DinB family protein [Gemmatimonadales bacterium]
MPAVPQYDRPDPSEYAPFYAGYVAKVPEGDLLVTLEAQIGEFFQSLNPITDAKGQFAYAPGKWTIKEVLLHVVDAERVFSYRAMRIARADETPLPGFDEKAWVPQSGANDRTVADLLGEFRAVRTATGALLRHLPADAVTRRGIASGNVVTVRALAWIIAGHPMHHLGILRERYLV